MKYKIVPYIQQESKDIERITKYAYNIYADDKKIPGIYSPVFLEKLEDEMNNSHRYVHIKELVLTDYTPQEIKHYKEESTIEIPRAPFTFKEPEYDRFEAHWQQVVPVGIKNLEPIPHNMQVNMSKKWFNETVPIINYWIARKEKFRSGYNACMT